MILLNPISFFFPAFPFFFLEKYLKQHIQLHCVATNEHTKKLMFRKIVRYYSAIKRMKSHNLLSHGWNRRSSFYVN